MMADRLRGKTALVSGGARGMGAAHARRLVAEGASVVIGDILEAEGLALAAELGPAAVFCRLDVTQEADWERAAQSVPPGSGPVTVLLNNAGVHTPLSLERTSVADYRRIVEVNQVGVFLGMRVIAPVMAQAGGGSIVNVSSTAAVVGYGDCFAYSATKGAIVAMTKAGAAELAPQRVRVNCILPGDIDTAMSVPGSAADRSITPLDRIPLGRLGTVDEVAALAAYLASDEAAWTTGACHVIDGGTTAV